MVLPNLWNCGNNVPQIQGNAFAIVAQQFDMRPNPTTGLISTYRKYKNRFHLARGDTVQGRYDESVRLLTAALAISRSIPDARLEGAILNSLSDLRQKRGQYQASFADAELALAIAEQLGDVHSEACALGNPRVR